MTYKELLFKMAQVGMLTLSSDKDGRGLFWVGMDNMDALEKQFDWKDFEGINIKRKKNTIQINKEERWKNIQITSIVNHFLAKQDEKTLDIQYILLYNMPFKNELCLKHNVNFAARLLTYQRTNTY